MKKTKMKKIWKHQLLRKQFRNLPLIVRTDGEEESQETLFPYNMEMIRHNVKELNIIAGSYPFLISIDLNLQPFLHEIGEGLAKIVNGENARSRKLGTVEPLVFSVFKNGIMLGRGPFRPFGTQETEYFINDILDGYFPYELKDKYPDGGNC